MYQIQNHYHPIEPPQPLRRQIADPVLLAFWQTKCLLHWARRAQPLYHQRSLATIEAHRQAASRAAWETVAARETWDKRDAERERKAPTAPSPKIAKVSSEEDLLLHRGLSQLLKDLKAEEKARQAASVVPTDVLAPTPSEDVSEQTTKRPVFRVEPDNESFLL